MQLRLGDSMSVQAHELMSETWTRWQGHVVNGVFPLGRYLGSSDHSGVFLTLCAARYPSEVAIKLVPANRALAESLLPRWKRAGTLTQPHLLRLLEWGGCQLDGLPFLYLVMEYADQTLAQLLPQRALTEDEAREMLVPILHALAFLHGRNLVQGQLKPANILVVGEQLKVASDTIRPVNEDVTGIHSPSRYDPPEAQLGSSSTAGDIWALGASLFEALTRRQPPGCSENGNAVALPADFSPAFRDIVTRCLRRRPESRPSVSELVALAQGRSTETPPATIIQPLAAAAPEPTAPEARVTEPRTPEPPLPPAAPPQAAAPQPPAPVTSSVQPVSARLLFAALTVVIVVALGWTGVRALRANRTPSGPSTSSPASGVSASAIAGGGAPVGARAQARNSAVSSNSQIGGGATASPTALHEVIPDVPLAARRTIRGHIKVWVRVIVANDGSVFGAVADRAGSSRYFERLAIEAAKGWRFAASDTASRRLVQLRFEFTRDGTTGRAVPLH
jgi:serine/threonine protein kinase